MVSFKTVILKFDKQGEKTGWTYILIPSEIAAKIKPDLKKSFRVKGRLDNFSIKGVSLLPMGEGDFIMPLNASMRKNIGKRLGAILNIDIEEDTEPLALNADLIECLSDDPEALNFFNSLAKSHQNYF